MRFFTLISVLCLLIVRGAVPKSGKPQVVGELKPGGGYHPKPDDHRPEAGSLDDSRKIRLYRTVKNSLSGLVEHVVGTAEGGSIKDCITEAEGFSARYGGGLTLGDEKGEILSFTVATTKIPEGRDRLQILELGSHSGDGTLRFLSGAGRRKVKIVSVEENPHWLQLGKQVGITPEELPQYFPQLIGHAVRDPSTGRARHTIEYTAMLMPEGMDDLIEALQESGMKTADIIFMDHNPSTFKQDLTVMLERGFAGPGTVILVDNAGTKARLMKDYLSMVQSDTVTASPKGLVKFNTVIQKVSVPYADALAVTWIEDASSDEL